MQYKNTRIWLPLLGGCFFVLDQLLKYTARSNPRFTWYIMKPWLGWEYFENPGVAFSLPAPNILLVILTPILIICIIHFLKSHSLQTHLGLTLLLAGALSNFTDRVLFGFTIDYLRILTGILNIGDVLIAAGGVLLLFSSRKKEAAQ